MKRRNFLKLGAVGNFKSERQKRQDRKIRAVEDHL